MKLGAVALTLALGSLVAAPTFAASTSTTVLRCFCQQLDTQRKAEAQRSQGGIVTGVPTTTWPDIDQGDTCIQTTLGIDHDAAASAFLETRTNGALAGINEGITVCAASGYSVDETTPEPASPAIMQAARDSFCKMMAETKELPANTFEGKSFEQMKAQIQADAKREGDQIYTAFAAQVGVSKQMAETVLSRASAERDVGKFKCPGE